MPALGATQGHSERADRVVRRKARKRRRSDFNAAVNRSPGGDAAQAGTRRRPVRRARPYVLTSGGDAATSRPGDMARANRYKRTRHYKRQLAATHRERVVREAVVRAGFDAAFAKHARQTGLLSDRVVRDARIRYLRANRVQGQELIDQIASLVARSAYVPNTGGGPNLGARGVRGTFRTPRGTAAVLAPKPVRYGNSKIGRALVSDIVNLGTSPFVAGVAVGGAGVGLARGDTRPARRLVKGVVKSTVDTIEHPGRSLQEHPLNTLLLAAGGVSGLGRSAGAVARGVGSRSSRSAVRRSLAKTGTTVRPPLALVDDAGVVRQGAGIKERSYSKDLTRKAVQVAADKRRKPLRDREGRVVTVMQRGHRVPVLRASQAEREGGLVRRAGLLGEQANFEAARANALERQVRHDASRDLLIPGVTRAAARRGSDRARRVVLRDAGREVRARGIRGQKARDVSLLVAGGTIRSAKTFSEDLGKWRTRIAATLKEHERAEPGKSPYRHPGEVARARANVKLADALLERARKDPDLAGRIVAAGESVGRRLNETERELLKRGVLSSETRAERARVIHAAVEHSGARYFREDELRDLERRGHAVRDPAREGAHRTAREARDAAQRKHQALQDRVRALARERSELVGTQRSRRGRRGGSGRGTATVEETQKLARATAKLSKARRAERAERPVVRKAQRKLDRTPRPPIREALRRGDGRFLSTREIQDELRSAGRDPGTVAYVPTESAGGRAFHARFDQSRPVMDKPGVRTGEQYRKGATETTAELLREHGVHQQVQLTKARQIDRMVEGGMRHPSGRYFTAKEAEEFAKRATPDPNTGLPVVHGPGGQRFVAMRAHSAKLSENTVRAIEEGRLGSPAMDRLHLHLINDRIAVGPGARNAVLVPFRKVEQLQAHLAPAGHIEKFFQLLNKPFRMAVLPQPRWLAGNFIEPFVIRLTAAGSGLNVFGLAVDMRAAKRVLRTMERSPDPRVRAAAAEVRAQQFGGLFVGGGQGRTVHRGLEDFPRAAERYGQLVSKLPAVRQAAEMTALVGRAVLAPLGVFFHLNRVIETAAQRAALGRQFRRDFQEFTGSWAATVRLEEKAVADAAKGLVNTASQQRFMGAQHDLLGKYEGFGPVLRRWIQGPMPFLPWALNAARFVYWTMPAHHTALTAALLQVNSVVEKAWADEHRDVPPGSLKFALPTEKGGWVDLARYTPFGLFTEGGVTPLTNQIAPQAQGPLKALGGSDPFGRPLQLDPTENPGREGTTAGQRAGIFANSLAEALTPYLGTARRLREGGGTAYAGSTIVDPDVKPGTKRMSAARRVFDPLRPTYLRAGPDAAEREVPAPGAGGDTGADELDRALGQIAQDEAAQQALEDELDRALQSLP